MSKKYKTLIGYNPELEEPRQAYYEDLVSTEDREIRKDSARGMASLTSLRSMTFVRSIERKKGLRDD